MRSEWKDLTGPLSPVDLAAKHDHLVSDIRGMITHAGDTSNLILDPDLDSYYLMDVTLLALPQAQERLARVGVLGSAIIRGGELTQDHQIELAVQASMMQEADLDRIVASTGTSLSEDPNFYGVEASLHKRIPPALKSYQDAASTFIAMNRRLVNGDLSAVTEQEYLRAEDEAHRASFEFWNVAVAELDGLLGARITSCHGDRNWSLGLASLSVVAACILAFFLARSIVVPLRDVMGSLGPGASLLGVCAERIEEASKNNFSNPEETALICEELSAHAVGMRENVLALARQVEGA
jgi:methyl-accepting chemotaxis protein